MVMAEVEQELARLIAADQLCEIEAYIGRGKVALEITSLVRQVSFLIPEA